VGIKEKRQAPSDISIDVFFNFIITPVIQCNRVISD
jgi:hypothetical protein